MTPWFITLGKKNTIPVSCSITFELVLLVSQCINLGALNQGGRDRSTVEVMTPGNVREGFKHKLCTLQCQLLCLNMCVQ